MMDCGPDLDSLREGCAEARKWAEIGEEAAKRAGEAGSGAERLRHLRVLARAGSELSSGTSRLWGDTARLLKSEERRGEWALVPWEELGFRIDDEGRCIGRDSD